MPENIKLRLSTRTRKLLRLWAALFDLSEAEVASGTLANGLARLALERGREFHAAFSAAWQSRDTAESLHAEFGDVGPAEFIPAPAVDFGVGEDVRLALEDRAAIPLAIYSDMTGEGISDIADAVIARRILELAAGRGESFCQAFLLALAACEYPDDADNAGGAS